MTEPEPRPQRTDEETVAELSFADILDLFDRTEDHLMYQQELVEAAPEDSPEQWEHEEKSMADARLLNIIIAELERRVTLQDDERGDEA